MTTNPFEPPKEVNEPPIVVNEPRWAAGWRVVITVSILAVLFAVAFAIFVYVVFPPGLWHWSVRRGGTVKQFINRVALGAPPVLKWHHVVHANAAANITRVWR